MNTKAILYVVLFVLIGAIILRSDSNIADDKPVVVINPNPKPIPEVIVPTIEIPKLETNYIYDNLDKALVLGGQHKRNIIIVFGAEWCPYCVVLKNDAKKDKIQQYEKYIVCFLDTDNTKANQKYLNIYRPKSLPTSIAVDSNGKEFSRKIGYKNKDYISWLQGLK